MVSTPALIIFLTVVAVYLTGCLIIHIRETHGDKLSEGNDHSNRTAPRQGGPHAIHL
jgi:hypothetical protein